MHSAVMQNKKYIKFASKNTVEVIALQRLDEAVQKKDRRAATYMGKGPDGKNVELMVAWPNLTYDQMIALNRSKAGRYNNSGKIPYTAVVDPHTEKEFGNGYTSAKAIIEAVEEARKGLVKAHGKGIKRKEVKSINEGLSASATLVEEKEFAKALSAISKIESKKSQSWPASLADRLKNAREDVIKAAKKELEHVEFLLAEDAANGKKALRKLISRLKGTGLEESAKAMLKAAS